MELGTGNLIYIYLRTGTRYWPNFSRLFLVRLKSIKIKFSNINFRKKSRRGLFWLTASQQLTYTQPPSVGHLPKSIPDLLHTLVFAENSLDEIKIEFHQRSGIIFQFFLLFISLNSTFQISIVRHWFTHGRRLQSVKRQVISEVKIAPHFSSLLP